jgi:hypothetical protein
MSTETISVKAFLGDEARRFSVPESGGLEGMLEQVHSRFSTRETPLVLKFKDDEDELCMLSSDEELAEAVRIAKSLNPPILRMYIVIEQAQPAVQPSEMPTSQPPTQRSRLAAINDINELLANTVYPAVEATCESLDARTGASEACKKLEERLGSATTAATAAASSTLEQLQPMAEATAQKLQPMAEAVADGLNAGIQHNVVPVVQQLTDPRNYEAAAETLSNGASAVGSKLVEFDEQTGASTQLKRLGDALNEHVVPALNDHVMPHVENKIQQFDEHTGASAQLTKLEASLTATVTTAAPHLEKGLDSLLNLATAVVGAVRTRPCMQASRRGSTVETTSGASVETSSGASVETSSGASVQTSSGASVETSSGSTIEVPSRFVPASTEEPAAAEARAAAVDEPAQDPAAATEEPLPAEQPARAVEAVEEPVPMSESFVADLSRVRDAEMAQLNEMGFLDDETNRVALDKANGNITLAVDILTGCDGFTFI